MSKVYGMHMLALRPGVTEDQFETFVKDEVNKMPWIPGWNGYILKGIRGDRENKYLAVFEIESVETLDKYYLEGGAPTDEGKKWIEANPDYAKVVGKFQSLVAGLAVIPTDYIVIQ